MSVRSTCLKHKSTFYCGSVCDSIEVHPYTFYLSVLFIYFLLWCITSYSRILNFFPTAATIIVGGNRAVSGETNDHPFAAGRSPNVWPDRKIT